MLRAPVLALRAGDLASVGALMARISQHAAQRWVERINPRMTLGEAEAAMMLSARAIDVAAAFGATGIRLACGARLVLSGDCVVTVKAAWRQQISATRHKCIRRKARADAMARNGRA